MASSSKYSKKKNGNKFWNGNKTDKCLVLDLDLTLVHTFTDLDSLRDLDVFNHYKNHELRKRIYMIELHDVVDDPGQGVYSRMWGVFRPGWERFRNFASSYFSEIFVWSAGQPRYVDAMTNILFPDQHFQPTIVYTWDNCQNDSGNIYKPLDIMFSEMKPESSISYENVFVLDDREDTFSHNPQNGILIPAYEPLAEEQSILQNDDKLLQLENWFCREEVAICKDVRTLNKDNIFV